MIPPIKEVLKMKNEEKSTCPNWKGYCDSDLGEACIAGATCPARGGADAVNDKKILVGEFATMPANIAEDLSRCIREFGRVGGASGGEAVNSDTYLMNHYRMQLEDISRYDPNNAPSSAFIIEKAKLALADIPDESATAAPTPTTPPERVVELEAEVKRLTRDLETYTSYNAQASGDRCPTCGTCPSCQWSCRRHSDENRIPAPFPDGSVPGMVVSSNGGDK